MADRHRLGTFVNGRFTVALDLAPANGTWAVERDTFTITPPAQTDIKAHQARRYGGSRRVGEVHDNGNLAAQWFIKGANLQATLIQLDSLLAILENTTTTYFWEWRPDGATYSTYFEVRGTSWEPLYRWVQTAGTGHLHVKLGVDVAPLALGDQLDITDGFDVDTITAGDYTFDTGAGTLAVAGGLLTASSTAEKRLIHTARGYTFTDVQATLKFTVGTVTASKGRGLILKRIDANNFLSVYIDDSLLTVRTQTAGVDARPSTNSVGVTVAASTTYWVRGRIEGNVVTAEFWTSEPTPSGTPTATVSVVLGGADATNFGAAVAGAAGMRFGGPAGELVTTDATYDDFRVEPYTYKNRALPEVIDLRSVPGTAPAKVDVSLGQPSSSPRQLPWGLIGWATRPAVHNLVWNGDFEDAAIGTSGWSGVGDGSVTLGTATLSRDTTTAVFGAASMKIALAAPGVQFAGARFPIYRRFKKGVAYTFQAWVKATDANVQWDVNDGVNANTVNVTADGAWHLATTVFTPAADRDVIQAVVRDSTNNPTTNIWVDAVQAFEGTVAPTTGKHSEGKGAYPPFGILQGEAAIPSTLTGWAITASGSFHGGYDLEGNATAFAAEWFIDPALVVSDDFATDITFEVYARLGPNVAAVSATAVLSAIPESNQAQRVYTNEWGSAGKTLVLPSSAGAWRINRLGALTLPVDPTNPSRWRLKLAVTQAVAAALDLDYLLLVPARQRALGPTGKANDSSYPGLFHTSGVEELKTIRADLSGRYSQPPGPAGRDSGLGGQLLEVAPGDVQALLKLSDVVPDDPTNSTYAEAGVTVTASAHFAVQPRYQLTRSA